MSSNPIKSELTKLYNANKYYLPTIGFSIRTIKHLVKLGFSYKAILNVMKSKLAKHNQFNEVSNEILEEYEYLNNPFNEAEIMTQLHELEKDLSINDIETQIKIFNPDKNTLQINFVHGSKTLFKKIKQIIVDKVNDFHGVKQVYFQLFFKVGGDVKFRNYSLNSEEGFQKSMAILNGEPFDLIDDLIRDGEVEGTYIDVSDDAGTGYYHIPISAITGFKLCNKKHLDHEDPNKIRIYADNGGSFYPYKINAEFSDNEFLLNKLRRYQITNDLSDKMFDVNCLTYALMMSGKFNATTISNFKIDCFSRYVSHKQLEELGNSYNIAFKVVKYEQSDNKWHDITHGKKNVIGSKEKDATLIELALIHDHYILNETIEGITPKALKQYIEIKAAYPDKDDEWIFGVNKQQGKQFKHDSSKNCSIKSYEFIQIITSELTPFSLEDLEHLPTSLYDLSKLEIEDLDHFTNKNFILNQPKNIFNVKEYSIDDKIITIQQEGTIKLKTFKGAEYWTDLLEYLPNHSVVYSDKIKAQNVKLENKVISFKEPIKHTYFYADTETDVVSSDYHQAYCISYQQRGSSEIKTIIGKDCLEKFMDVLPDNAVVYFHNLGYDAKMFNDFDIMNSIDKGSKTMSQTFKYNKKNITFKDSLSIISMSLAKFPKTFNLKSGEKEMFPYKYYTIERLTKEHQGLAAGVGKIDYPQHLELKHTWNQKQFEDNIAKLGLYVDINGNHSDVKTEYFDMKAYVKFYCEQDVNILAQGFDKFREMCLNELNIDIDEILTAASLANKYFEQNLYFKVKNFYKYSGVPRAFIQQAIYGGRCMTRDNKKWRVSKVLADFDAVSLYPSAMKRLYIQTGKPKVLSSEECNWKYLSEHTCEADVQPSTDKPISTYVVKIRITKVNKKLHFPLIVTKDPKTKTNRNTNEAVGSVLVVDNITLEDFVKYQGVECEILGGYKWTSKKDYQIRGLIQHLHELRCKYKAEKNPLQEVIKLIMNSAYGKCIQKPIKDSFVYKKYRTLVDRKVKGKTKQVEEHPLDKYCFKNSAKIKEINQVSTNMYQVKVGKSIADFATNTLLGVQILSMSKRIMNEVMCTAEDLGIEIFYQDTDSMHIEKDKLDQLAAEFKNRYGRELIGKNLGQFHNDFDEVADGYSIKSIFLGKKAYIDILTNDKHEEGVHYRMKGVTLDCIKKYADNEHITLYDVYESLLNNNSITFDLLTVKPRFKSDKNRHQKSVTKFTRCVKFCGPINEAY